MVTNVIDLDSMSRTLARRAQARTVCEEDAVLTDRREAAEERLCDRARYIEEPSSIVTMLWPVRLRLLSSQLNGSFSGSYAKDKMDIQLSPVPKVKYEQM